MAQYVRAGNVKGVADSSRVRRLRVPVIAELVAILAMRTVRDVMMVVMDGMPSTVAGDAGIDLGRRKLREGSLHLVTSAPPRRRRSLR